MKQRGPPRAFNRSSSDAGERPVLLPVLGEDVFDAQWTADRCALGLWAVHGVLERSQDHRDPTRSELGVGIELKPGALKSDVVRPLGVLGFSRREEALKARGVTGGGAKGGEELQEEAIIPLRWTAADHPAN